MGPTVWNSDLREGVAVQIIQVPANLKEVPRELGTRWV